MFFSIEFLFDHTSNLTIFWKWKHFFGWNMSTTHLNCKIIFCLPMLHNMKKYPRNMSSFCFHLIFNMDARVYFLISWSMEIYSSETTMLFKQNFYRNDLCLILNKIPIIVRFQHLTWLSLTIVISYEPIYEIYVWNMAAIEGFTDPQVLIFKLQVTRQPTTKYAWLWTRKRNAGTFGTWGIQNVPM